MGCNGAEMAFRFSQIASSLPPFPFVDLTRYIQAGIMSPIDYGWQPIELHEIILEGFDGAVIIKVGSLLATSATLSRPNALGLTTTIRINRANSSPSVDTATNH